jgi:2,3-bisphosphoglycerate-dependent phosphoglycerate mutase
MTRVYFVRHAQPEHNWKEDRTRPLTEEGKKDSDVVLEFLKDKKIDAFYCSPYKRSIDTIADAAAFFGREIITDERLREREKGLDGNNHGMYQKRWADHDYHEEGGESIAMVQRRNIEALNEILSDNTDKDIVIGTHGTALSTILNFYDNSFGCEDFLRIIDWMPYIIELDFEGDKLVGKYEHCHVEKEIWDLYDENRELLGKDHVRGEQLPIDGYHLVVHVWIRNSKGEYLISQRSANRPTHPLMWECVGGSVVKGEDSLQGAIREAKEEVGVDLKPENGQVLFTKIRKIIDDKIFNDIMDVWLFEYDGEVDLGNATTDEVAQVTWMNREQIKELFEHNMFVETLEYFFSEVDK